MEERTDLSVFSLISSLREKEISQETRLAQVQRKVQEVENQSKRKPRTRQFESRLKKEEKRRIKVLNRVKLQKRGIEDELLLALLI